jgi:hypothetical protein
MPIRTKPCEVSHSTSGPHFQPDFDGTNIQVFEKILVKQYPAEGHCFLSLRQFSPETWARLELENYAGGLDGFAPRNRLPSHRDSDPE